MVSTYAIVGSEHAGVKVSFILDMEHRTPLVLRRDPKNKFDKNAIEVYWQDQRIGFVKATQAAKLARRMDIHKLPEITANLQRIAADGHTRSFPICEVDDDAFSVNQERTDERPDGGPTARDH